MSDELEFDLYAVGGRALSVFGAFGSRLLIEMPTAAAPLVFRDGVVMSARAGIVEAVERDLAVLRERSPALADSALGAVALALAYEIENPYNSATAKAMCSGQLRDTMGRLRELLPPVEEGDDLDDLTARRLNRTGRAAT